VVQGAVNPDEFYVYKPALRAGKLAILRRNLGAKAVKMVYAPAGSPERVQTVAVPPAERHRFCLSDADILTLARQALIIEEHYERPMDIEWARDGAAGDLHPAGPARDGAEPRRAHHSTLRSEGPLTGAGHRPQHRPAHRAGSRARHPRRE